MSDTATPKAKKKRPTIEVAGVRLEMPKALHTALKRFGIKVS